MPPVLKSIFIFQTLTPNMYGMCICPKIFHLHLIRRNLAIRPFECLVGHNFPSSRKVCKRQRTMWIDTINISHQNIFFLTIVYYTCECVWTTFSFLLLFSPFGGLTVFHEKKMQNLILLLSSSYIWLIWLMGSTQGKTFNLISLLWISHSQCNPRSRISTVLVTSY